MNKITRPLTLAFLIAGTNPLILRADLTLYGTDFDGLESFRSLTGQESWTSNDIDVGLGYGSTDGLATLTVAGETSKAGFLGGFYRNLFSPGQTEILLWPELPPLGSGLTFEVEFVLVGSTTTGLFSATDTFGWSLCDDDLSELLQLCFEPTSSVDNQREIVIYDHAGTRHSSGLNLFLGSSYAIDITVTPGASGDRAIVRIDDSFSTTVLFDEVLPAGTFSAVTCAAASWKMMNATLDPVTGIVSGFGSNFMVFDHYEVRTAAPNQVYVPNLWVAEAAGSAVISAQLCAPLSEDLELFYQIDGIDAVGGADFALSSPLPSLLIPAGNLEGSISIPIIADTIAEADETFEVQLTGTSGPTLLFVPEAVVMIIDDDDDDGDGLSNEWEILNGLDPDNPEDAILDLDGNGASALLEYALGLSGGSGEGLPELRSGSSVMEFVFKRDTNLTNLALRVETSTDLVSWTEFPDELVSVSSTIETRQATIPLGPKRTYVRLTVESFD